MVGLVAPPKLKSEVRHTPSTSVIFAWLLVCWLMTHYRHISKVERMELSILLRKGYTATDIAHELGRHRSTIYRELQRNRLGCDGRTPPQVRGAYHSAKADHKAYRRRKYAKYQTMCIVGDMKLREYIDRHLLDEGWSPEQIAGRLAHEAGLKQVSAPTIYNYIRSPYGRQLEYELQLAKQKRKARHQRKVTELKDRVFIDQRPQAADVRTQYGHWEGDFIVSGRQYGTTSLLVLHERVSRYTIIRRVDARTAQEVEDVLSAVVRELGPFKSLTLDNDIAFARHRQLSELIGAPIYFCYPYHSWEKGGVENANRLIRRYVPKGCDISTYTHDDIAEIQDRINGLPRKILGYKMAREVYADYQHQAERELSHE
jgi:transposase, IS30 family